MVKYAGLANNVIEKCNFSHKLEAQKKLLNGIIQIIDELNSKTDNDDDADQK